MSNDSEATEWMRGAKVDIRTELFMPKFNCFVAYLDMLGMKDRIRDDPDKAWLLLCDLERARTETHDFPLTEATRRSIREIVFSDTTVLVSKADRQEDLHAIIARSLEFFRAVFERGIPIRGGIAHGSMIISDCPLLFIGQALVDAHDLGENQQFLGISIQGEAARRFREKPFTFKCGEPVLVDWDVPTKEGRENQNGATPTPHVFRRMVAENRPVLNWPALCFPKGLPATAQELYERFEAVNPFSDLKPEVQRKYENTLPFVRRDC